MALTRAQDALIITVPLKRPESELKNPAMFASAEATDAEAMLGAQNWALWLLTAAMLHPASEELWKYSELLPHHIPTEAPLNIRLLDPPLHEFLPQTKEQQLDLAQKIGMPVEVIMRRVAELHEFNPMLGHRGCRLGIAYPEITEMQARAIFEAAVEVSQEEGFAVVPEIMVPLVAFKKELDIQKAIIDKVAQQVFEEKGTKVDYLVGTMIEIPRAAVTADEIAETAQFFSFGTNDLTQTGLGMSRDDSGSFLPQYQELEIIKKNVFASIDQEGVGKLMKIAVELGRSTRPDIKLGICGEHGGDPASVKFCNTLGLTYVSCSPYRVPTARLAAAQAALEQA